MNFLPLDAIVPQVTHPDKIQLARNIAQRMGKELYHSLECVRPNNERFDKVVKNIYGDFFITNDVELAKEIAFHPQIRKMVITKEGDKFDPRGFVSGGALKNMKSLLSTYDKWKDNSIKLKKVNLQLSEFKKEESALENNIKDLDLKVSKRQKLEKSKKNIELEIKDLNSSSKSEINKLNQQNDMILQEIEDSKDKIAENEKVVETLRRMVIKDDVDPKVHLNKQLEMKEQSLKKNDSRLDELNTQYCEIEDQQKSLKKKLNRQRAEFNELETKIQNLEDTLDSLSKEKVKKIENVDVLEKGVFEKEEILREKENEMLSQAAEQQNIVNQMAEIKRDLQNLELQSMDMDRKRIETEKELDDIKIVMNYSRFLELCNQNNECDMSKISVLKKELKILEDRIDEISPKLNKNVDNKKDQLQQKMQEIAEKKTKIADDCKSFNMDVKSMDGIKQRRYHRCFKEVNKNLKQMFSKLLPGAQAEMEEMTIDKEKMGIQIRIAFNGKWKESLSELSGGQRSLLALSLLLAMLKYSPAPFYILDEIDAAMDLSHTENIGEIISDNFPESQFLVISLKKDMYKHANVLFKTKLDQGHSAVERIQQFRGGRSQAILGGL